MISGFIAIPFFVLFASNDTPNAGRFAPHPETKSAARRRPLRATRCYRHGMKTGTWIAIGVALGVAIGSMMDNIGAGIGIGIGIALGLAMKQAC